MFVVVNEQHVDRTLVMMTWIKEKLKGTST